jgi:CheY-like chemotaxis protein
MTDRKSRPTKEAMHHEPLVLIVDDDPEMRELLETLFKLIGFATFQAGNNTEALAQALTHHPDLITTDMFRPGGSGHEFIQLCMLKTSSAFQMLNLETQIASLFDRA